ncbi:protein enabled homolog isoform X2 [Osmerus eperlanus]|uniref:protein enabled homolog isoform X2 n=1 Tax=Osmerus eperlanus TaxID=29151 RepID=UPI002E116C5B
MDENAPPPPPPPLPPPQLSLKHGSNTSTPPCPGQAAIPFAPHESKYPVQETNPTAGALPGTRDELTPDDEQAIRNLMAFLGRPRDVVHQVYMDCNKNTEAAANFLLDP